jgi:flagella synthesis protein FlgN
METVPALIGPAPPLADEIDGYRSLNLLLRTEQDALRAADADALAQVAAPKRALVHLLQDMDAARTRALHVNGLAANASGMRALLARCPQPERAAEHWDVLVDLAGSAQRQNLLNARLAGVQQRHVQSAMAALWNAAGHEGIYGADGRALHQAHWRSFAAT